MRGFGIGSGDNPEVRGSETPHRTSVRKALAQRALLRRRPVPDQRAVPQPHTVRAAREVLEEEGAVADKVGLRGACTQGDESERGGEAV